MASPMIKFPGNNQLPRGLLENTAGVFVTGDPGCGKSVLGREFHRSLAMSGDAMVIVLDPDNDFVEDCQRDLSDMPLSVRQRAHAFFPADPRWPIGAINPLHVDRDETMSDYEYEARLECRAMFASHLLLSAVNQADFDGAPLLLKWATTINRSLARMHMTMPEAEQFFDIGSPDYQLLTSAIPDEDGVFPAFGINVAQQQVGNEPALRQFQSSCGDVGLVTHFRQNGHCSPGSKAARTTVEILIGGNR